MEIIFHEPQGYRKRTSPMFMRCNIDYLIPKIITLYEFAGVFTLKTRFSQAGRGKCLRVKFDTHVQKSMFFVKTRFSIRGQLRNRRRFKGVETSAVLSTCQISVLSGGPADHAWRVLFEFCQLLIVRRRSDYHKR